MNEFNQTTRQLLCVAGNLLLRCAALGLLLLAIWVAGYAVARDTFHAQGQLFGLTPHELDVIHYCGMGLLKTFLLLFFVFPYISIRLMLKKSMPTIHSHSDRARAPS